jgi:hypothetical protein
MWMAAEQEPLEHLGVYGVAEVELDGAGASPHAGPFSRIRVVAANRGIGRRAGELDVLRM